MKENQNDEPALSNQSQNIVQNTSINGKVSPNPIVFAKITQQSCSSARQSANKCINPEIDMILPFSNTSLHSLPTSINQILKSNQQYRQQLLSAHQEITKLQLQNAILTMQQQTNQQQINLLTQEAKEYCERVALLQTLNKKNKTAAKKAHQKLKQQNASLRKEKQEAQNRHTESTHFLSQQLQLSQSQIILLKDQQQRLEAECQVLKSANQSLSARCSTLEAAILKNEYMQLATTWKISDVFAQTIKQKENDQNNQTNTKLIEDFNQITHRYETLKKQVEIIKNSWVKDYEDQIKFLREQYQNQIGKLQEEIRQKEKQQKNLDELLVERADRTIQIREQFSNKEEQSPSIIKQQQIQKLFNNILNAISEISRNLPLASNASISNSEISNNHQQQLGLYLAIIGVHLASLDSYTQQLKQQYCSNVIKPK